MATKYTGFSFDLRDRVPARCHAGKFIYVRENSRT